VSRRRALHVINGEYFGGSARVLMNYLEAEARASDVVVAHLFEGTLAERCRAIGIETVPLRMRGRWDLTPARHLAHVVRESGIDLLHSHQARNTLLARLAARMSGRPLVTHVHSPQFRESTHRLANVVVGTVDRALAHETRRFICVSESLGRELRRQRIDPSRIRVVPNGVEAATATTPSERDAVRSELGLPDSTFAIAMIANFRPRKGADVLIDAFARVAATGLDACLYLVGEPFREHGRDYGETLRGVVAASGAADRIVFTGFVEDPGRIVRGFDVMVLPSRFGEGMPMVLLEAMVRAIPVVSTPVEGTAEVIAPGENGELVPVDDAGALATVLLQLAREPARRARLAAAGRETVLARYTTDVMARGIESVYDELVARPAKSGRGPAASG
jgi:glycosyltransferase involved in cell wall biosynthesis